MMKRVTYLSHIRLPLSIIAAAILAGCASVSFEQNVGRVNEEVAGFAEGKLTLARTNEERTQRAQAAATLLKVPVGQKEAVQLALVNSPALQGLLAQGWAEWRMLHKMGASPTRYSVLNGSSLVMNWSWVELFHLVCSTY